MCFLFFDLVLNRVKDFLPLMAAANNKLEKEISINKSDAFDVENIKDDDAYVEMVSCLQSALRAYPACFSYR